MAVRQQQRQPAIRVLDDLIELDGRVAVADVATRSRTHVDESVIRRSPAIGLQKPRVRSRLGPPPAPMFWRALSGAFGIAAVAMVIFVALLLFPWVV
jgi:hypothetical protein